MKKHKLIKNRQYTFITTHRYLDVPENISETLTLMPGVDIITDKSKILGIINNELKNMAGVIEADHLLSSSHIVIGQADSTIFPEPLSSNEALMIWLIWLDMLINDSWLVKDNTMLCEVAYARLTTDGSDIGWSNNYLRNASTLSNGQHHVNSIFTLEELISWESMSNKLRTYLHMKKSGVFASFINKDYSRIGRSLRFITAARKENHLAMKIAHYCSSFESLFSTEASELTHKLSERVAIFLKNFGFDAMSVFDDMKSFYQIRSKVTHGDSIQITKESELPKLSVKCDDYLRKIINSILNDSNLQQLFDGNKSIFENHFKKLLLGY